jgi:hypothetical protein
MIQPLITVLTDLLRAVQSRLVNPDGSINQIDWTQPYVLRRDWHLEWDFARWLQADTEDKRKALGTEFVLKSMEQGEIYRLMIAASHGLVFLEGSPPEPYFHIGGVGVDDLYLLCLGLEIEGGVDRHPYRFTIDLDIDGVLVNDDAEEAKWQRELRLRSLPVGQDGIIAVPTQWQREDLVAFFKSLIKGAIQEVKRRWMVLHLSQAAQGAVSDAHKESQPQDSHL